MTIRPMIDMMEATRLTREGRLAEAMDVLRGARSGADATTTVPSRNHDEKAVLLSHLVHSGGGLPSASAVGEHLEMLELVQRRPPAA
jgi:hypothetical protein